MHPTRLENLRSGTGDWWRRLVPPDVIEGYADATSVAPGQRLGLHVAAPTPVRYRVNVFRLGWYDGLGGRLIARTPASEARPKEMPNPADEDPLQAGWPVTDVIDAQEDWASGQYIAQLEVLEGPHAGHVAHVPFVVRPPAAGPWPRLLVQTPVNTVQAYNNWGGRSLYASNSRDHSAAVRVSFDRPLATWDLANPNARAPFAWDIQLIRFLERTGVDVGYQTNVDSHRDPASLARSQALMSSGHDEYWTAEIRDAWDAARDRGSSLFFMGANLCYWQCRYEDDLRTLVVYRDAAADPEPDAARKTVKFRDLQPPRPEHLLIGVQYQDGITDMQTPYDFRVARASRTDSWATADELDASVPLTGLVGYEWDALVKGCEPPGLTRLLHYPGPPAPADCVAWQTPAGGIVLATGSLQFSWGLDAWARKRVDPRAQALLRTTLATALRD